MTIFRFFENKKKKKELIFIFETANEANYGRQSNQIKSNQIKLRLRNSALTEYFKYLKYNS